MPLAECRPRPLEAPPPAHERAVVVGAHVVPVLQHELPLRRGGELGGRRHAAAREDVAVDPRVRGGARLVLAARLEQEEAIVLHRRARGPEEPAVVLPADVLHHADAHHLVERAREGVGQVAVVELHDLDPGRRHVAAGVLQLAVGDVHARHAAAVPLVHPAGQPAPAASDVEDSVAGLQPELAADQVHLRFLRAVEVVGWYALEVRTGVLVVGVQERHVEAVVDVVVTSRHGLRPTPGLQVDDPCPQHVEGGAPIPGDRALAAGTQRTRHHLVERIAFPPAVHVRLAQAQRAVADHAVVEAVVAHADVPRAVAVHPHVGGVEDAFAEIPGAHAGGT